MRIISGNFKGKKILEPKDMTTRPLKDLTKESIFNIILHSKKFKIKSRTFGLKKFDEIGILENICFIKIDVEGFDELVLYGMKKFLKKNNPVILVEYNKSNFLKIYDFLKEKYNCYFYDFDRHKLKRLNSQEIFKLIKGEILEKKEYKKNSVNIFFIKKNQNKVYK